jgi:4-hydroxy-tetrahydrodipicolinate synthase
MYKGFCFQGIVPALVTPFTERAELDLDGLKANVEYLIPQGIWGVLVCGSTGEAASLTREEKIVLVSSVAKVSQGRVQVIAGTGAPSTAETIRNSLDAKEAGADALLVVTPYYLIPTQEGIYQHYKAVNDAVELPMLAYNIPAHTGNDIQMSTLERIAGLEHVVGMKESSGRGWYMADAIAHVGDRMALIEGGDDTLYAGLCIGAAGCILALCNLAPAECVAIYTAVQAGRHDEARSIYYQILPIARAISVSVNFPAGVKAAVEMLGRKAGPCRSPIQPLTDAESKQMRAALIASRLLSP